MDINTLGRKIQEARKKKGMTQKELAERLHVAPGTLQRYELGTRQPRLEALDEIANILEIDVWELIPSTPLF